MNYGRPPTGSLANRPSSRMSSQGGPNGWNKAPAVGPQTAVPPRTGIMGGTSRGQNMTGARPVTGSIRVVDRPMTQQGLGGMRTSNLGTGRVVQDITYFQSELRQKINLLNGEIGKLNSECDTVEKENSNYNAFEKRADSLAQELRELQGQLGDLNTLVDKLHTDSDLSDIERHCSQLKAKNERESQILEEIFSQRQMKENHVREIESLIEEERQKSEAHINDLDSEKRNLYFEMKEQNAKYVADVQKKQIELDDLHLKIDSLSNEVRSDSVKQRTLSLYEKLSELRSKKVELEEAIKTMDKEAGPQEKSRLLEQVKEDNQETSAMERKLAELEEQSLRLKQNLSQIDIELDSHQSDRTNKYEELLKRDKEMQNFIETFDERRKEFKDRNENVERSIVALLDRIKVLTKHESMPSQQEHKELQGDLKFKEKEMKNSENTMDAIVTERDRRLQDLEKVNQLETKLHAEVQHLKEKMNTQTVDLRRFGNIEEMKAEAEERRHKNSETRDYLKAQRNTVRQQVQLIAARYEGKKAQLQENETFTQLGALEQRLKHHESNNFHLKEYINSKSAESDYKPLQADTYGLIDEISGQLSKLLSLPPAR